MLFHPVRLRVFVLKRTVEAGRKTDLVLTHYKETLLFIDVKRHVQETLELRVLI